MKTFSATFALILNMKMMIRLSFAINVM